LSSEATRAEIGLGKDWKFKKAVSLTDACKEALGTQIRAYPNKAGRIAFEGDYAELLKRDKVGAVLEKGIAEFKSYGVLMVYVK
jgi:hypothetical protein